MANSWKTPVGARLTRRERGVLYGGALYGGIEPSDRTPNVFVYSDPGAGEEYGYNFDGWTADRSLFMYTGDGQLGPQYMTGGNKSLLRAAADGRTIRLFIADGFVAGTKTKNHVYIGAFRLDPKRYDVKQAPDRTGKKRDVFVFRLQPVETPLVRPRDVVGVAAEVDRGDCRDVPVEGHAAKTFNRTAADAVTAERTESELVKRYVQHLRAQGRTVGRKSIRPPGRRARLVTDVFDQTEQELYEAKGDSSRESIRMALGQLLDYRRVVQPKLMTVLVPSLPEDDLIELLAEHGVGCVYASSSGGFTRVP